MNTWVDSYGVASPRPVGRHRLSSSFIGCAIGVLLFTVTSVAPSRAQTVSQIVFLPQTFFVGDIVEARVVVRTTENLDLVVPGELPDTPWVDMRSVAVVQRADGYEVRITFQPFFVGTRRLPELDLGSFTVTGVSAVVNSLAPPEDGALELQPVRDQLLLPGTQLLIALFVVALVGVPTAVVLTGGWVRRWAGRLRARYRENRPYRAAQKGLKQLQADMHELDGKRYYIRLLDLTRGYLAGRFSERFRSATTGELDIHMRRAGVPAEKRSHVVDLFRFGDLVKFAARRVTVDDRTRHLEEVRDVVTVLQKMERENDDVGS